MDYVLVINVFIINVRKSEGIERTLLSLDLHRGGYRAGADRRVRLHADRVHGVRSQLADRSQVAIVHLKIAC